MRRTQRAWMLEVAALVAQKGDWAFIKQVYRFSEGWSSHGVPSSQGARTLAKTCMDARCMRSKFNIIVGVHAWTSLRCHHCAASKVVAPLWFTHHGRGAAHRQTMVTTREYLAANRPEQRSPLCDVPGWRLECLPPKYFGSAAISCVRVKFAAQCMHACALQALLRVEVSSSMPCTASTSV